MVNLTNMSLESVLENWSDYDDRKKKSHDAHFFSCDEPWEVQYLVAKIHKNFSYLHRLAIIDAIQNGCEAGQAPHPRTQFVEAVLQRLGVIR